jgi:hypothetical protein
MKIKNTPTLMAALATAALLSLVGGCSSSPTSSNQTGTLNIRLVDSPAAYQQVNIVVTRVDVHASGSDSANGWFTINDVPATYDLLTLRNGASQVLGDHQLATGHYTQIRLIIGAGSNVVIDDMTYPLRIPSGSQTGIKLNHGFDIADGQLYELVLDFDADRSIHQTGAGVYMLKPVIRVQAMVTSGSISGVVLPVSARALVSTVLAPDTISAFADTVSGTFQLMALPAGLYSVVITPRDTLLADTTISGVQVVAQQNTYLGTVTLRAK